MIIAQSGFAAPPPVGMVWDCPFCGEVRPKYHGDPFATLRVSCPVCGESEQFQRLPWGVNK